MRFAAVGLVLLVCCGVVPAYAQYDEPDITFFYPLVTRRPIIERELEFTLTHTKGLDTRETEARLAMAYPASKWFIPLLELVTATRTRGPADEGESLLHKTQVYLVPGFNLRPRPGVTLRTGIQVPVTTAKEFDYRFHSALVVEF